MKSRFDVNNSFGITPYRSSSLGPMTSVAMSCDYAYNMKQTSSPFKRTVGCPVNTLATVAPLGTSYLEGW